MTEREALDKLLRFKPDVMLVHINPQRETAIIPEGSWVLVDFEDGERFAIWKSTGMCYRVDEHGTVDDEPVEV